MKRFSFTNGKFFEFETVTVTDSKTNNSIEVALRGANLLNYKIFKNGHYTNIIDGFTQRADFISGNGARNFIMAPYSNKINNCSYTFNGVTYKLDAENPGSNMRHGLVAKQNFEIYAVNFFEEFAELTFYTNILRKKNFAGYPFDVNVFVKYKFYGNSLTVEIAGQNIGNTPAPFGAGWHAYFKTCDNGIDHLQIKLDADKIVLVDNNAIPFKGEDAYSLLNDNPEIDFRSGVPAEKRIFGKNPVDVCFTELIKPVNGFYETVLTDSINNMELKIFQQSGVTYVFTGDSLRYKPRASVAIEPVEFMTDAFNRPECLDKLTLKPCETKSFIFGVKVKY